MKSHGTLLVTGSLMLMALTLLAGPAGAQKAAPPEIVAHRGASAQAPENTLAAYRLAWQMGSPAAEVDVWLTKDGRVIALHDNDTERTTGVKLAPRQATFAELAVLDAGAWKKPFYTGERIPLLEDMIAAMPAGKRLFVEIKDNADIVPHVKEIIEASGKKEQIVIIGFSFDVMRAAQQAMPDIPVKWLLGAKQDQETGEYEKIDPANVQKAKEAGFEGLNVSWRGVTPELIAAAKAAGQELYVWTVNDPAEARRLVEMGVAGVTTDVPDVMMRELGVE